MPTTFMKQAHGILRDAEVRLCELIPKALEGRRDEEAGRLMELARLLADARCSRAASVSGEPSGATTPAAAGIPRGSGPERKRKPKARKKKASPYPKFFREGNALLKLGWSRKSRTEYEHRAPREADGSELYPEAIAEVFPGPSRSGPGGAGRKRPGARHQLCEFHVPKEIVSSVLQALAKVRKEIEREIPKLPRGRPTKKTKPLARKAKRLREKKRELFDNRHLFVRRRLTDSEKNMLEKTTRGHTEPRRFREIMDEAYGLFDRRCRTETALVKLARPSKKARRFKHVRKSLKKLWSKNLEKALTFLDDSLLPATSGRGPNARTAVTARCRRRYTA